MGNTLAGGVEGTFSKGPSGSWDGGTLDAAGPKFSLLKTLNTAENGASWIVSGTDADGEPVAVKILKRPGTSTDFSNLQREIAAMRALSHPHIVTITAAVDTFVSTKDFCFLVTELADCDLLTEIERHDGLDEDLARKYWRQLLDAVAACHAAGVAHRDIKPDNCLIGSRPTLMYPELTPVWCVVQLGWQAQTS